MPAGPKTPHKKSSGRGRSQILLAMLAASLLLHVLSLINLDGVSKNQTVQKNPPVKIKLSEISRDVKKLKTEEDSTQASSILEAQQKPTERPKQAKFLGAQDHQAEREMKTAETKKAEDRGKAVGQEGSPNPGRETAKAKSKMEPTKPVPESIAKLPKAAKEFLKIDQGGTLAMGGNKPRNKYEALLPTGSGDLLGQVNAGHREYIDEDLAIGDRVDINTTNYRYVGYFAKLRQAIELVWIYPQEAVRRGLQGVVNLEFKIEKSGKVSRVRIVKSSGYDVLDRAIVDAIKLAAPFDPLPEGMGKDMLIVSASFRYVLYAYNSP